MFTSNWTFLMNALPILIILIELKCTFSMPRQRYRIYRSKGSGPPPFPRFLSISPPRMASAQNFHSDYATPPFLMNGPPNSGYTHPPIMDYAMDHPNGLQLEYGPPSTTSKPVIHKHVFVHIPPPEPEEPIMRYFSIFFTANAALFPKNRNPKFFDKNSNSFYYFDISGVCPLADVQKSKNCFNHSLLKNSKFRFIISLICPNEFILSY